MAAARSKGAGRHHLFLRRFLEAYPVQGSDDAQVMKFLNRTFCPGCGARMREGDPTYPGHIYLNGQLARTVAICGACVGLVEPATHEDIHDLQRTVTRWACVTMAATTAFIVLVIVFTLP